MAVNHISKLWCFFPPVKRSDMNVLLPVSFGTCHPLRHNRISLEASFSSSLDRLNLSLVSPLPSWCGRFRRKRVVKANGMVEKLARKRIGGESSDSDDEDDGDNSSEKAVDDSYVVDEEERQEWRRKIWDVIDQHPDFKEHVDLVEKRTKMQKLLADYPLIMEEEDPNWPEDADGWGFNLDQFFSKITIKNVKKDNDDEEDENFESDKEIVWQDDDYIRPIKDITAAEWEEIVFKDISPLIVLVHNRYKSPKKNEEVRDELEKAVHIIWNCSLPSPRCVAVDAVVEHNLVSALQVSVFPEIIFTKAGRILYREKGARTADEFSKIMAFFYYGAAKPPCLDGIGNRQEHIPSILISHKNSSNLS